MTHLFKRVVLAIAIVFAFAGSAFAAPTFPALTGRVVDDAHVLSPDVTAQLTQQLADLEQRTTRQLVVVTLPSLQGYEIEDYGYQLGRAWGIGQKKLNNGVLFIIAPNEHRVRIEVGYGLEPVLTDALSSVILNTTVLPKFKAGDMQGGIVAGTDAIVKQLLLDTSDAKAKVSAADQQQATDDGNSGGGFSWVLVVFIVIVFIVVYSCLFGVSSLASLTFFILSGLLSGGGSSDSEGGGGFSGGGGSFGGGGASGSW